MSPLDLNNIVVFVAVVDEGSFTAAGLRLAMPKSTVSKRISDLESFLNARLLERTTRKLAMTEAGRLYYAAGKRMIQEVDNGQRVIEGLAESPRGTVKISLPFAFARSVLAPVLPLFLEKYPEIAVHLMIDNHKSDLLRENIDMALRVSPATTGEDLLSEPIFTFAQKLVAAPAYIDKYGLPKCREDLLHHRVIGCQNVCLEPQFWQAEEGGANAMEAKMKPAFTVSEPETRAVLIKAGVGIGTLPEFLCRQEIQSGSLVQLLSEVTLHQHELYAVMPTIRANDFRVKLFLDFLRDQLG